MFTGRELAEGIAALGGLRVELEGLTVRLVAEAIERGEYLESGLSPHDWVAARCPWLSGAERSELVTVAMGIGEPAHRPVRDAVCEQGLPVRRAARVLRCLQRVRGVTDPQTYAQDVEVLLSVATDSRFSDGELKRVTDHLLSVALEDKIHDAKERAVRQQRGVNESSLADGSLTRFVVTADAEGAALIRAILASPLAAPAPDADGPDPRTAPQRRYDALTTVLGRGVAGAEGQPTTPKAQLVVQIRWDHLRQQLTGTGTTLLGDTLTPQAVRRLACEADLIPQVLGTAGEILDQGRRRRLVTPGQRTALAHRDRGCTYPGCTTPAPWCDAHHITPWSHGGPSDLTNYALLCPRHHTRVHDHDLTATITTTGVHWQHR